MYHDGHDHEEKLYITKDGKNILSFIATKAQAFVNEEFPRMEFFKCNKVEIGTALDMGAITYSEGEITVSTGEWNVISHVDTDDMLFLRNCVEKAEKNKLMNTG